MPEGKLDLKESEGSEHIVTNRARGKMIDHAAVEVFVREFPPIIADEPPSRGGKNKGPSPLEHILIALYAWINVSTARMAKKLRFQYENIETSSEGILDTRGSKGLADVPVHNKSVYLTIKIRTDEPDQRLRRLSDLVTHYCPVDSFVRAAVPDYHITWERIAEGA
jgi:putative redox protein